MIGDNVPKDSTNIHVSRENVELVISEDESSPLSFVLPPLDDLIEIKNFTNKSISIKDWTTVQSNLNNEKFGLELNKLQRKIERYPDSATIYNRLANFAHLKGDLQTEGYYLGQAKKLSSEKYFLHRIGDNLIARNLDKEAEVLFNEMDLFEDSYANLRLASLLVGRGKYEEALGYVQRSVELDTTDYGARLFQGALRLVLGNPREAISSFRIASEERPTSSVVYTNLALAYLHLDLDDKAMSSLRRAVALNPLNSNALVMFADLAFKSDSNEDVIPSLRYFLEFEQKSSALWARFARALLAIGKFDESISALKRQAAIEKSSAVWNNLGVAYHRKREYKKAFSAFQYAMSLDSQTPGKNFYLAARNTAVTFSHNESKKELLKFIEMVIASDTHGKILVDKVLCDIVCLQIHTFAKNGKMENAVRISERLYPDEHVVIQLRVFAATGLLSFYSLSHNSRMKALELVDYSIGLLDQIPLADTYLRDRLLNNIAFVFAEFGMINMAEKYISRISSQIHVLPYPTSVLGLIHFRKGNIEKAKLLYEEALKLALDQTDKVRIRQKMNLELGIHYQTIDISRAFRFLSKVIDVSDGDSQLVDRAKSVLSSINGIGRNPAVLENRNSSKNRFQNKKSD
nr:tetratricopeptide repeat protein [uncultured Undibacterium sp.]